MSLVEDGAALLRGCADSGGHPSYATLRGLLPLAVPAVASRSALSKPKVLGSRQLESQIIWFTES
jgi:hypothetical protein